MIYDDSLNPKQYFLPVCNKSVLLQHFSLATFIENIYTYPNQLFLQSLYIYIYINNDNNNNNINIM